MKDFFKTPRSSLDANAPRKPGKRGSRFMPGRKTVKPFLVFIAAIIFISGVFLFIEIRVSAHAKKARQTDIWKGSALVLTEQGLLRGFNPAKGLLAWRGVDYAAAPIGALRWRSPRPALSWAGARPAEKPGTKAVQYSPMGSAIGGSEDCLHLNLWRPESRASGLPVYVWIHGGANTSGFSSPDGDYDGQNLASLSGFLVVSIDYRLGPLGWFEDADLVESGSGGNLGFLDILAALHWIRDNAYSFGGDPDNVTVAGESAGASNILGLLLCDRAKRLFKRAILQSPLDLFSTPARSRQASRSALCRVLVQSGLAADARAAGEILDGMTPERKKAFFLSVKAEDLLAGIAPDAFGMYDWPCLIGDGKVLPADGMSDFSSGHYPVKVPLIIGSNHDEVGIFLFVSGDQAKLMPIYDQALAWGSAAWNAWVEGLASKLAKARGQPPVRLYRFDWGSTEGSDANPLPLLFRKYLGAFHSLEIPFFIGNDTVAGVFLSALIFNHENAPGREALSSCIRAYTADFARGGPMRGGRDLPSWPPLLREDIAAKSAEAADHPLRGLVFDGNAATAIIRAYSVSGKARLLSMKKESADVGIERMILLLPSFLKATLSADG
jgi:para-nitrobenzyl esterase